MASSFSALASSALGLRLHEDPFVDEGDALFRQGSGGIRVAVAAATRAAVLVSALGTRLLATGFNEPRGCARDGFVLGMLKSRVSR